MRIAGVVLGLLVIVSLEAQAQKKPRSSGRGVPCGNSYIAPGKTCHIGTPPAKAKSATDSLSDSAAKARPAVTQAGSFPTPVAMPTPAPTTTMVPLIVPLYEKFLAPLEPMLHKRVVLRNAAIDEKWMRTASLAEIHSDHLMIAADGAREIRIPISSIEFYYTDPATPGELTIVLRR